MSFIPKTGSFEGMKSLNKSAIMNLIRLQGPISRAEIAKLTKLTPPTVGSIVSELLEADFIKEETGFAKSQGGRKPIMLTLNSTNYFIIGIYGSAEVITTVISNLDGEIIYSKDKEVWNTPSEEEFLTMLKECIQDTLDENDLLHSSIIGIGVAMHGLVDPVNGIAIFAPHLNLSNIPIKNTLEDEFSIPVLMENDVRALTLAENWYGKGKDVSDFICISVGRGIGSGIVLNHKIYNGAYNSAGEIGHTIVDVNGPRCKCGNYGCLEAFSSEAAVLERVKRGIRLGRDSILAAEINEDNRWDIEMIFRAAEKGDQLALESLEESGRYLGLAIANFINIFTPSKVILEGKLFDAGDLILSPIRTMVERSTLKSSPGPEAIECSTLGKKGMAVGACTLVLRSLFKPGGF